MESTIADIISSSEIPKGFKFYITSDQHIISCVANLLGNKVVPIVETSIFDDKPNKTFFYTPNVITTGHLNNDIYLKTFYYERRWLLVIADISMNIIASFLNEYKGNSAILGYTEYKAGYSGYEYSKGVNVTKGLKFTNLIGIDDERDSIITDINRYFDNLNKYRSMGVNRGLNYVIYGPPGTGKTSFVIALVYHYHANLFIPENSGSFR